VKAAVERAAVATEAATEADSEGEGTEGVRAAAAWAEEREAAATVEARAAAETAEGRAAAATVEARAAATEEAQEARVAMEAPADPVEPEAKEEGRRARAVAEGAGTPCPRARWAKKRRWSPPRRRGAGTCRPRGVIEQMPRAPCAPPPRTR
jgi:hypothetical protein